MQELFKYKDKTTKIYINTYKNNIVNYKCR